MLWTACLLVGCMKETWLFPQSRETLWISESSILSWQPVITPICKCLNGRWDRLFLSNRGTAMYHFKCISRGPAKYHFKQWTPPPWCKTSQHHDKTSNHFWTRYCYIAKPYTPKLRKGPDILGARQKMARGAKPQSHCSQVLEHVVLQIWCWISCTGAQTKS